MILSEMQGKTLITNKLKRVLKNIPNIFSAILLFVFSSYLCIAQTGLNETHKDINSGVQPTLLNPSLVSSFYKLNRQQLFWFSGTESHLSMRKSLVAAIDSAMYLGLDNTGYLVSKLLNSGKGIRRIIPVIQAIISSYPNCSLCIFVNTADDRTHEVMFKLFCFYIQ